MAMLNIRIDESTKRELQEIAKLKNETLSSLALEAIHEIIENEFDYKLGKLALNRRKSNEEQLPIDNLYKEYEI